MKTSRRLLLLGLPVIALTVSACGDVKDGDVAAIKTDKGVVHITKAQFDRFFLAALSQQQQKPASKVTKLVPPNFTACIAEKRKGIPAESQRKKTSNEDLKKQCQKDYDNVANSTLQGLINYNWTLGEAERLGRPVRKAAIARQLDAIIKQNFQTKANFDKFLKDSGLTQADVDVNVAGSIASQDVGTFLQADPPKPNAGDVRRYFEANAEQYAQPETRDLRLILTTDEAKAKEAKKALEAGGSWKTVAEKYSVDQATKSLGGQVVGTTLDVQPPQFKSTVFTAKVGSLVGPIKTDRGYYVVKVQKITYSKKPTFKEYKAQAEQQLASELLQAKVDRFREAFTIRWAGRTSCASDFNDLAACDDDALRPSTPAPLAPAPGAVLAFKQYDKAAADKAAAIQAQQLQQQVQTAG